MQTTEVSLCDGPGGIQLGVAIGPLQIGSAAVSAEKVVASSLAGLPYTRTQASSAASASVRYNPLSSPQELSFQVQLGRLTFIAISSPSGVPGRPFGTCTTSAGIGFATPQEVVVRAYGRPARVRHDTRWTAWAYDSRGVAFAFDGLSGSALSVAAIGVFRPGDLCQALSDIHINTPFGSGCSDYALRR